MKIGKLRHRITIQEKVTVPDGYGGVTSTWKDVATVWSSVEPLKGRETVRGAAGKSRTNAQD